MRSKLAGFFAKQYGVDQRYSVLTFLCTLQLCRRSHQRHTSVSTMSNRERVRFLRGISWVSFRHCIQHNDLELNKSEEDYIMVAGFNAVIDISHHNGTIDFAKVGKAGIRGVIQKATQGQRG